MTFEEWLNTQPIAAGTIDTQLNRIERIRRAYPDLDKQFEQDNLKSLQREFIYTMHDERQGRPNPTRLEFVGNVYNNLASFRATLNRYVRYKQGTSNNLTIDDPIWPEPEPSTPDAWPGFEKDMQQALRQNLEQLELDMQAVDGGGERTVESGRIDITARDANGRLVIIELKTGIAGQRAVAQILSYMGDIAAEEDISDIRGMLVAFDFDHKARAAAKMVPSLELVKYAFRFEFAKNS